MTPAGAARQEPAGDPRGAHLGVVVMEYTDEQIAQAVHEVNGVLQAINGEAHRQPPWADLAETGRQQVRDLVRLYRLGGTPRQAHEHWRSRMESAGLRWGRVRTDTTHPNLVAFEELPFTQRVKDRMSQQVVMVMVLGDRL